MGIRQWILKKLGCQDEELRAQIAQKDFDIAVVKKSLAADEQEIATLHEDYDKLSLENGRLKQSQAVLEQPPIKNEILLKDANELLTQICPTVYISDEYFQLTDVPGAQKFSEATKVKYRQWVAEDFDCDNFSFALMGYWSDELKSFAFGIAWSDNHAFNIMIDDQLNVWIVEPQTNEYFSLDEAKRRSAIGPVHYWPMRFILM